MTQSLANQATVHPTRQPATRSLDTAVGILVGWRRASSQAAFRELISVSERHGVPIFALAAALVALASRSDTQSANDAARLAAEKEWGLNYLL